MSSDYARKPLILKNSPFICKYISLRALNESEARLVKQGQTRALEPD
jgi:hypothetical protein